MWSVRSAFCSFVDTCRLHVRRQPDWTPPEKQNAGNKGNLQAPEVSAVAPRSARLTRAENGASRDQNVRGYSLLIGRALSAWPHNESGFDFLQLRSALKVEVFERQSQDRISYSQTRKHTSRPSNFLAQHTDASTDSALALQP
jgi:hypothetical protein